MLTQISPASDRQTIRFEAQLCHDGRRNMRSLGCTTCPQLSLCGGLQVKAPLFDCLDLCCGKPDACDKVCRRNPHYAKRVREVEGYALDNIPRTNALVTPTLPSSIPLFFHGSRRSERFVGSAVALPLARMYQRRDGSPRYASHQSLCDAFQIEPGTPIVLSGTDHDASIERWWGMGEATRRNNIRALIAAGVALATVPNYSVFTNVPHWDDMHAMKRIGWVHYEFLDEGLPAALHVNGRTDTDFRRWADYLSTRPEIGMIAYEFATGPGRSTRLDQHVRWLAELASRVPHPLQLVVRGAFDRLHQLRKSFAQVIFLDTSSFMKTMMRQQATLRSGGRLTWSAAPTLTDEPLDCLLTHNIASVEAALAEGDLRSPVASDTYDSRELAYAYV